MSFLYGDSPEESLNALYGYQPLTPDESKPTAGDQVAGQLGLGHLTQSIVDNAVPAFIPRTVAKVGAVASLAASNIPHAADQLFGTNSEDWWHKHVTDSLIHTAEQFTPDPKTTNIALNTLDSFLGFGSEFIASGANPLAFGLESGVYGTAKAINEGKDLETATMLGGEEGLSNSVFTSAPISFASRAFSSIPLRVQGAVTGAIGMNVLGAGSEELKKQILEHQGYPEEANQHDWSTVQNFAFNTLMGGVFGALHQKVIPPSVFDAFLTANQAHALQHPENIRALTTEANTHLVNGMHESVDALVNDRPVTTSIESTDGYQIPEVKAPEPTKIYNKQDFIEQARLENPKEPARKIAKIADEMANEANKPIDNLDSQDIKNNSIIEPIKEPEIDQIPKEFYDSTYMDVKDSTGEIKQIPVSEVLSNVTEKAKVYKAFIDCLKG